MLEEQQATTGIPGVDDATATALLEATREVTLKRGRSVFSREIPAAPSTW